MTHWTASLISAVRRSANFTVDASSADVIFCDFETGFESWWPGTDELATMRITPDDVAPLIEMSISAVESAAHRHRRSQIIVFEAALACGFSRLRSFKKIDNLRLATASANIYDFQVGWDISIPMFGLPHHAVDTRPRDLTWSFMGSISHPIRQIISEVAAASNGDDGVFETIEPFSQLSVAPSPSPEQRRYCELLSRSQFALCPRGDELYSFRFAEALRYGAIPVVFADGWISPFAGLVNEADYLVRIPEANAYDFPEILRRLDSDYLFRMRENGKALYEMRIASPDSVIGSIVEELATSTVKKASSRPYIDAWRCCCGGQTWPHFSL